MKETSSESPDINGNHSGAHPVVSGFLSSSNTDSNGTNTSSSDHDTFQSDLEKTRSQRQNQDDDLFIKTKHGMPVAKESSHATQPGPLIESPFNAEKPQPNDSNNSPKKAFLEEVRRNAVLAATYSWLNVLLVFVPVGIAVAHISGIHGGVVFAMNCIAVIPLAGLLAFATESVARKMGDALGALLNVTFGNAVELIIFIIALVKNEIRIVQASLLGSILANLLLILGMGFFLGGMRYREQIYNSTVTQMSACLLSLAVCSLVLPTAFHASFSDTTLADAQSLKISRGTSVILLLVYILYLLFQLKSHAYMYESTPQHIVDAEATPGPAAAWLDSSSSEDSSSSSDSDDSDSSHDTMRKRVKKVFRGGRRRKSSVSSADTNDMKATDGSFVAASKAPANGQAGSEASSSRPKIPRLSSHEDNEHAVDEGGSYRSYRSRRRERRRRHKNRKSHRKEPGVALNDTDINQQRRLSKKGSKAGGDGEPRRVDFAVQDDVETGQVDSTQRPFPALRGISVKNLAPSVFTQKPEPFNQTPAASGSVPHVRYGIRRTNSLPERLDQTQYRAPGALLPSQVPLVAIANGVEPSSKDDDAQHLSQIGSIVLLLVSTALVAVCAELLVGSIKEVVSTSSVGETFIGLIILPIVGNAAEHVTAITVAMKNKMDLAIGVAVGSSIQIAIFITPLVVILGWIMEREMTLYFTLFETVCLFVSAFVVNFLVLDGRSNYLEGALLCAVYLIISIVAFFYPDENDVSSWGG